MLDLMIPPIVAALIILSLHAYLGLHVIAREVMRYLTLTEVTVSEHDLLDGVVAAL